MKQVQLIHVFTGNWSELRRHRHQVNYIPATKQTWVAQGREHHRHVCVPSETPAAVCCCSWDGACLRAASSGPSVQPATTPRRSERWGLKRTGQVSAAWRALLNMLWCLALRPEILCEQSRFRKSVTVIHRRKTVVFIELKMTQHGTRVNSIHFLIFS